MQNVFIINGYKFYFYSNEGFPREACHIHIRKDTAVAKFWVLPEIYLESSWGFSAKELNYLENIVKEKQNLIHEKWYEYFG